MREPGVQKECNGWEWPLLGGIVFIYRAFSLWLHPNHIKAQQQCKQQGNCSPVSSLSLLGQIGAPEPSVSKLLTTQQTVFSSLEKEVQVA